MKTIAGLSIELTLGTKPIPVNNVIKAQATVTNYTLIHYTIEIPSSGAKLADPSIADVALILNSLSVPRRKNPRSLFTSPSKTSVDVADITGKKAGANTDLTIEMKVHNPMLTTSLVGVIHPDVEVAAQ